mmetsp:Transcript_85202/g.227767  ORF Transcript_85202/g.227767 Transcript_85202/m.227767 type:complete len:216 (-) Transcript_85202:3801-4448(-)
MLGVTLVSKLRNDKTSTHPGSPARKAFTPSSETKVSETSTCTDRNDGDNWSASVPMPSLSTQQRASPRETFSAPLHMVVALNMTWFVNPTQPVTSSVKLTTVGTPPKNVLSPASEMHTQPERVTSKSSSMSGRKPKGLTSLRLVHSKKSKVRCFRSPGKHRVKFAKPMSLISLPGTAKTKEPKSPGNAFANASNEASEMREWEPRSPMCTSRTSS